ncbi:uncharacterized protein LOC17891335 isoform X2 [Capsella rubella]|uniref:uncharacterized protein LOC17891335 isoform X2 n=1 Tax=Capsella rubella TaxID=81985 RepID=UPI000CD57A2C|nr:uncharacterized protein LOC17891335 isoform X2 [Capsella rubella]
MAILSTCWLIVESIVIRDGFLKSSNMRLYMHPLVLFLCQLLIWFSLFFLWLLPSVRTLYNAYSSFLVTLYKLFSSFLRVIMVRREVTCNIESSQDLKNTLNKLELARSIHSPIPAFSFSFKYQVDTQLKVLLALREGKIFVEEDEGDFFYDFDQEDVVELLETEGEEEEEQGIDDIVDAVNIEKNLELESQTVPLDQEVENSITTNDDEEEDIENSDVETDLSSLGASDRDHSSPLSIASLDSACQDSILVENPTQRGVEDVETDQVYKNYCERMRWYDILSRDRTYGLSAIMNQVTASSLSLWGETAEKRLKQSIKRDLELVYVAQSCLSWEALLNQYITVRDHLKPADSRGGLYEDDISRDFQNFQVLLERFLEDESCQGKRVLSFVQRRVELMSFFQVPRLSGYNREGPHEGAEERQDKQVLKAIERCIEVFYDFLKVDIKKPLIWERLKTSLTNSPLKELEDPKDFKLFLDLKYSLQKEQLLKEMQGNKKKIWFKKKYSNMEETIERDGHDLLVRFIMIDLKLVSRVLHMSLVSSSHLKWCQQKLNNIHFNGDKISRTFSPILFPSS